MIKTEHLSIRTPVDHYVFQYPKAEELAKLQRSVFWTAEEIPVENDKQDFLSNMTFAEQEAVKVTLKLFTLYELLLGGEVWGGKLFEAFPRPEIQMMCSAFSFMELNVHAPFYARMNQTLMLDTEDFYTSYKNDAVLSDRISAIHSAIGSDDLLLSVATFALLENCVLYSNFAFLKHFQSQGKNLLANVVSGINFSSRDENIHAMGAAWLFNTMIEEAKPSELELVSLHLDIQQVSRELFFHEARISDMLFSNGEIAGINSQEMLSFIASRIAMTLEMLGLELGVDLSLPNPIASWFYDSVGSIQQHDFFVTTGSEYSRNVSSDSFSF